MALVKYNNNSLSSVTSAAGFPAGAMTLISTTTASSDSAISITSGIDSTYPIYVFKFINMHPATDNVEFSFQANASGGSGYNETVTSTMFYAYNDEGGGSQGLGYSTSGDQAQGTSFIKLGMSLGNDNDQSLSGHLCLFNPSSTVFVKHFIARCNYAHSSNYTEEDYKAGYFNITSAIDEIQFKMSSGNIDSGQILLFGLN